MNAEVKAELLKLLLADNEASTQHAELLKLLQSDSDATTKLIEGIVTSSFTIRGWGITLVSALIGLTFQAQLWQVAGLAVVVTLLIAFIDGYHSWLYAELLEHASAAEKVLIAYYASLARGEDDPQAQEEFEVALSAYSFGRYAALHRFRLRDLREARPRSVIIALYATLLVAAVSSGFLAMSSKKSAGEKFECNAVSGPSNVYICNKK